MPPPVQPPAYPPPAYGPSTYAPPSYGEAAFAAVYDAETQVYDRGLLTADPYADAQTGPLPVTPPLDAQRDFGPPPRSFEPAPGGLGGSGSDDEPDDDEEAPLFSRFRRIRSHARQRRSRAWVGVLVVIVLLAGAGAGAWFWPGSPWYRGESEPTTLDEPMPFRSVDITPADLGTEGFVSWAYEDLSSGTVVGSSNMTETSEAGPLITAWFGADLLRRAAENGQEPADADLAEIEAMIIEEDPAAAERVVASLAGTEESLARMGTMCHLVDLTPVGESWPATTISARDAARLGGCLADGRAAGAQWTPWLLNVMRQVHRDFGIREAFPTEDRALIAVANAVVLNEADGQWRANCLAMSPSWSLAVLQRYPSTGDRDADLAHLDTVCRTVASRLTAE